MEILTSNIGIVDWDLMRVWPMMIQLVVSTSSELTHIVFNLYDHYTIYTHVIAIATVNVSTDSEFLNSC